MHPLFFFFNDTATTEIYTLSLHDALPISVLDQAGAGHVLVLVANRVSLAQARRQLLVVVAQFGEHIDRKSTRLNSSHANISYAVFCLKKKNIDTQSVIWSRFHAEPHSTHR